LLEIRKEVIQDIPLLHIVKAGKEKEKLPLIFFIHGFTSAKEHNLHFAYHFAEKGYRAILPEAVLHGERGGSKPDEELVYDFWDIVIQTIKEAGILKEELVKMGLADEARIGMAGTSMGGIVTLGCLTQYDWIKAAVSLMGSPNYEGFASMQIGQIQKSGGNLPFTSEEMDKIFENLKTYDLSARPEKLRGRPLMFWHGKKDPVVPFHPTYEFYQSIRDDYEEHPDDLAFIADETADHKVTREALLRTVDWFDTHL